MDKRADAPRLVTGGRKLQSGIGRPFDDIYRPDQAAPDAQPAPVQSQAPQARFEPTEAAAQTRPLLEAATARVRDSLRSAAPPAGRPIAVVGNGRVSDLHAFAEAPARLRFRGVPPAGAETGDAPGSWLPLLMALVLGAAAWLRERTRPRRSPVGRLPVFTRILALAACLVAGAAARSRAEDQQEVAKPQPRLANGLRPLWTGVGQEFFGLYQKVRASPRAAQGDLPVGRGRAGPVAATQNDALNQLRFTSSVSQAAASAGNAEVQAQTAQRAFTRVGGRNAAPPSAFEGRTFRIPALPPLAPPPPVSQGEDKTPGQGLAIAAMALLLAASSIITVEGIVAQMAEVELPLEGVAAALAAAAGAMAAAVMVLGAILALKYNQWWQGMIFIIGGMIVAAAAVAALAGDETVEPIVLAAAGVAGIAAAILGILMPQKN